LESLLWDPKFPRKRELIKESLLNQLGLDLVPGRESVEVLVLKEVE
jgi:hypothetical protein